MTREEAILELQRIKKDFDGDVEGQGSMADQVINEFLLSLGYEDVVAAWDDVPRWYA